MSSGNSSGRSHQQDVHQPSAYLLESKLVFDLVSVFVGHVKHVDDLVHDRADPRPLDVQPGLVKSPADPIVGSP